MSKSRRIKLEMSSTASLARAALVSLLGFGLLAPGSLITLGSQDSNCVLPGLALWAQGGLGSALAHATVAAALVAYVSQLLKPNRLKTRLIYYVAPAATAINFFAATPGVLLRLPSGLPQAVSPLSFSKVNGVDVLVHAVVFAALQVATVAISSRLSLKSIRLEVVPEPSSGEAPKFLKLIAPADVSAVAATEWAAVDSQDAATTFHADQGREEELSRKAYVSTQECDGTFYLQCWSGKMQGYKAAAVQNGFDCGGLIHDRTDENLYTESWGSLFLDGIALPSEHAGGIWHYDGAAQKVVLRPTLDADYAKADTTGLRRVRAIMA